LNRTVNAQATFRAEFAAPLPLVETKLVCGRVRPELLPRRRLAALDGLSSTALTLIDAPVGFGKTVLRQELVRTHALGGRLGVPRRGGRRPGAALDVRGDVGRPHPAGGSGGWRSCGCGFPASRLPLPPTSS